MTKIISKGEFWLPLTGTKEMGHFTIKIADQDFTLPQKWSIEERELEQINQATHISLETSDGLLCLVIEKWLEEDDETLTFVGDMTWDGDEDKLPKVAQFLEDTMVVEGAYLLPGERLSLYQYRLRQHCFLTLFSFDLDTEPVYRHKSQTQKLLKKAAERTKEYAKLCLRKECVEEDMREWIEKNNAPFKQIVGQIHEELADIVVNKETNWPPEIREAVQAVDSWLIKNKGCSLDECLYFL